MRHVVHFVFGSEGDEQSIVAVRIFPSDRLAEDRNDAFVADEFREPRGKRPPRLAGQNRELVHAGARKAGDDSRQPDGLFRSVQLLPRELQTGARFLLAPAQPLDEGHCLASMALSKFSSAFEKSTRPSSVSLRHTSSRSIPRPARRLSCARASSAPCPIVSATLP